MSTPHPEQALFKAGLYEPAVKACQSVADVPDLMGKVQLLQAAIKYEQDDLMNTKAFIEGCPPEEAETSINHACVMYKEALQPGAEPAMFEKARLLVRKPILQRQRHDSPLFGNPKRLKMFIFARLGAVCGALERKQFHYVWRNQRPDMVRRHKPPELLHIGQRIWQSSMDRHDPEIIDWRTHIKRLVIA